MVPHAANSAYPPQPSRGVGQSGGARHQIAGSVPASFYVTKSLSNPAYPDAYFPEGARRYPKHGVVQSYTTANKPPAKKRHVASNIVFVVCLVLVCAAIVGAKIFASGGTPISFAGYSAAIVASSSMESVYPKGTLVITHTTDPTSLREGDDITYLTATGTSITHRIVDVYADETDPIKRVFRTQGVMNQTPDEILVSPENIVGKVVASSAIAGAVIQLVREWWMVGVGWVISVALLVFAISCITDRKARTRKDAYQAYMPLKGGGAIR